MRWIKFRHNQILLVIMILMVALLVRLFSLTVVEGSEWEKRAESLSIKQIQTSAPRGEILDRYGRLLAGNRPSFTVFVSRGSLESEDVNDQALQLVNLLQQNGEKINDNLPIVRNADGSFYYTHQRTIEEWLESQAMPVNYTAEEAFDEIRERYDIEEGMDRFEAQTALQNTYSVFPPISVRNMKFTEDLSKENFLGRYSLEYELTAEEAFKALREYFKIDPQLSDQDARKILIVRNELAAQGFYSYIPVAIATDISEQTIVTLEELGTQFPIVDVIAEPVRYYPNGTTAAHILGYLGRISEGEKAEYLAKEYNVSDMVGKEGLERAFEDALRGTDGVKHVEVNVRGELVRTISDKKAEKGTTIHTTIDLELQKTAEEALQHALEQISVGGTFESQYGNYRYTRAYPKANVGAAVAIEIETGDVLAEAAYPAFDPNLFATGISTVDWESLQPANPRDPLSPRPLYNVATRTAVQPGSTFKMVPAVAALESGLDPRRRLRDGGAVTVGRRTFGCIIWNQYRGNHGYLDLYEAIEVSCNYYFFDIATGRDFYRGTSLGLDEEMNIEKITKYAEQFGLGLPTGIEIPETVVAVPSAERKMSAQKTYLRNVLIGRGEMYFDAATVANKELMMSQINIIVGWMEENPSRNTIMERLANLGIKEDMIETVADLCKFDYFTQAAWTLADELNISIGQGENSYTPLQMANYIATIGNGGTRNKVSLLRAVEGQGLVEKEPGTPMDIKSPGILEDIIEGMRRVAHGSRGSARTFFANFPVEVAAKTGTAERAGKIHPLDEVEYLKTHLRSINSALTWEQVEAEMERLLRDYPDVYKSENSASRQAVLNLSRGRVTTDTIDRFKDDYDNYSWFVALAPAYNPKIAVAVLLFQGGTGGYSGPVAREIIGKYLELDKVYEDYDLNTSTVD